MSEKQKEKRYWTEERIDQAVFDAMLALDIKTMPTKTELMNLDEFDYEDETGKIRKVGGSNFYYVIQKYTSTVEIADRLKLTTKDSRGNQQTYTQRHLQRCDW